MNWNRRQALTGIAICAAVAGVVVAPAAAAAKASDPLVVHARLGKHTTLSRTHLRAGLITFVPSAGSITT